MDACRSFAKLDVGPLLAFEKLPAQRKLPEKSKLS